MATRKKAKSSSIPQENQNPRTHFRFKNRDHYDQVKQAVELSGLSMNSWLIRVTMAAARRELEAR